MSKLLSWLNLNDQKQTNEVIISRDKVTNYITTIFKKGKEIFKRTYFRDSILEPQLTNEKIYTSKDGKWSELNKILQN